ncbi:DUF5777 family beta-barrel protein [Hyunsoonleella pacifica]|uniref:DUF5777 domain-containing protein n=1 Tax=Hyunsoonleella pacifica TaxID=1080224 RepID=A0A4Q9FRX7_9FLAO|nr:DUF5777 family beta-barrel protein [Hyunsoonleella pacifica]TBN18858.1 hypothetical protein EYD46_01980 [Hyunsoonleella pacifica]GGD05383.1 hypothetical protein GCM10011368_03960 [Hyunsoonleella pacifica]
MKKIIYLLFLASAFLSGQEDLLDEIDTKATENTYETAAFKGLKIVNFESTKMVSQKELYFIVSHRFGSIETGIKDFFGLDQAVTRLNFVYGISDGINIGVSRSSFQKTYETSLKLRLLRQKKEGMPFTVVLFNSLLINTVLDKDELPGLEFKHRLNYAIQALISKKFSKDFSLELIPTLFHDNLVAFDAQTNTQFALGFGGRHKLSKRWSINFDYGLHLNRASNSPFKNPLSIGFDLETGGHVFQLHFTNAQPMNVNTFLGQATGDWTEGNIFFGFNLSRIF